MNALKFGSLILVGFAAVAACSDDDETDATTGDTTTSSTASTTTTGVGGMGGDGGSASGGGGASAGGGGASSCYADHPCDPLVPNSCGDPAAACDIGTNTPNALECYPTGNTAMLGEACGDPVFCAHGLTCPDSIDTCVEYCCTNDDCTTGTCQPHPDHDQDLYEVFICLP